MSIEFLKWDSQFFDLSISKLDVKGVLLNKSDLDFSNNDLYYVFSNIKQTQLEEQGALLADIKVTYHKKITKNIIISVPEIESYTGEVSDDLLSLGITSGWASRFNVDEKLQPKFEKLYKLWVVNSVNRLIADDVLVIKDNNKCIGLVTLKQNKDVGKIGIIAVDENYRGRELGKKLLQGADKWYFEKGLTEAEVVTQQTNPSACRFYERNGYSVKQVEYVYHVWK